MVAPRKIFLLKGQQFAADLKFPLDIRCLKNINFAITISQHFYNSVNRISNFLESCFFSWVCRHVMIISDDQHLLLTLFVFFLFQRCLTWHNLITLVFDICNSDISWNEFFDLLLALLLQYWFFWLIIFSSFFF